MTIGGNKQIHRRTMLSGMGATFVVGCTVGDGFIKPSMSLPSSFLEEPTGVVRTNDAIWWSSFQDPVLNQIVDVGLQQNLDVRRYAARIEQAQGILRGAGYPVVGNVQIAEARLDSGGGAATEQTGFVRAEATWKLDLFGRLKREKEAALGRLDAAYAELDVWRLLFVDEVITAYVDLRYFQELLRILLRITESREETLRVTSELAEKQEASELEVAQAHALVLNTQADLPEAKVAFAKSYNRIIALVGGTGIPNKDDFDRRAPQPVANTNVVATGVPADLVRNRPDIVRAENRLAEAAGLLGVAEADLYPSLRLTGNVRIHYGAGDFLPSSGFLKAALDVPLFDIPLRKSRIETAKAVVIERQVDWEKEVVLAVEEVRNSMIALNLHQEAVELSRKSVDAAREVLRLARKAFSQSEVSFLQVLDAERSFFLSESRLAQDIRNHAVDYVDLNVALGGSFGKS